MPNIIKIKNSNKKVAFPIIKHKSITIKNNTFGHKKDRAIVIETTVENLEITDNKFDEE